MMKSNHYQNICYNNLIKCFNFLAKRNLNVKGLNLKEIIILKIEI